MAEAVDLTRVSSDDLRAELERRKQAAQTKGRPLRYATKAEWADAKAEEFRKQLREVEEKSVPGPNGWRKKKDAIERITEQMLKFESMAAMYQRKGV